MPILKPFQQSTFPLVAPHGVRKLGPEVVANNSWPLATVSHSLQSRRHDPRRASRARATTAHPISSQPAPKLLPGSPQSNGHNRARWRRGPTIMTERAQPVAKFRHLPLRLSETKLPCVWPRGEIKRTTDKARRRGHEAPGVKRKVGLIMRPPVSLSDLLRGPGASGPPEATPLRRAAQIAPVLARICTKNGPSIVPRPFLSHILARMGAPCTQCDTTASGGPRRTAL